MFFGETTILALGQAKDSHSTCDKLIIKKCGFEKKKRYVSIWREPSGTAYIIYKRTPLPCLQDCQCSGDIQSVPESLKVKSHVGETHILWVIYNVQPRTLWIFIVYKFICKVSPFDSRRNPCIAGVRRAPRESRDRDSNRKFRHLSQRSVCTSPLESKLTELNKNTGQQSCVQKQKCRVYFDTIRSFGLLMCSECLIQCMRFV